MNATAVDERFGPIVDAMEVAVEPFNLLAGENIYMLTVLLLGSIADAPADVRELFRGAVIGALAGRAGGPQRGEVLEALCLRGQIK